MLVAAAALLAGCGTTEDPKPVAKTAASTTSTTSKASAPQATVQDFTSVVAEHHAKWDAQVATVEANCRNPRTIPACKAGYLTLGYMAETIRLSLSAAHTPSAPVYKGVPPKQIKTLLTETESAADAAHLASQAAYNTGCADPLEPSCAAEYMRLRLDVDKLSGKLDAWSVY